MANRFVLNTAPKYTNKINGQLNTHRSGKEPILCKQTFESNREACVIHLISSNFIPNSNSKCFFLMRGSGMVLKTAIPAHAGI